MNPKAIAVGALMSVMVLATSACGNDPQRPGEGSGYYNVTQVNVDGHDVNCITWKNGYSGGISCNWDEYNASK